jgi:penicillin amidase
MIERAGGQRPEMVDERLREALDVLLEWDKLAEADRVGSSIFHMWLKQMAVLTLKPHLGDELFGEWTTECGAHDTIIPLLMRIDRGETRLDWLNPEPDGTVTLDEAVLEGLKRAVEELEQKLGPDMTQWRWDRLHRFRLVHPLGVDWSPGPFGFHGSMDTVDHAEPFLMAENFDFTGGPSMRMVVDMRGRLEHAQNVIPGGQSGSRSGKHYNDQLPLWLENEARPMFFSQSEIEENAEEVFRFVPKCGTIGSG